MCQLTVLLLTVLLFPSLTFGAIEQGPPDLTQKVDAILTHYHISPEDVSIHALSIGTGQSILQINASHALIPASTIKILTTVSAFETFGSKHRYPTEIYTSNTDTAAVLPDLWIKGYGNPFFVDEELRLIARTLHDRGIREIRGPIYVDDSYFGPAEPILYRGTTGKGTYRVVTGALSYDFNRPEILMRKARRYKDNPEGVTGRSPLLNHKLLDPAIYTGTAFKGFLQQAGIKVSGDVLYGTVDAQATLILHHGSQPMADVLRGLNKESNNFIAEQILRSMAAARYGVASREMGLTVLAETLKSVGTGTIPYHLENASGLSRDNRLAALHLTTLLRHALNEPYGASFARTLSIAGVDGTLRNRFHHSPLKGKVWAKTGSLYQVSALAGYTLAGKEPIAFAIIVNDYKVAPDNVKRAQEKIIEAIVQREKSLQ